VLIIWTTPHIYEIINLRDCGVFHLSSSSNILTRKGEMMKPPFKSENGRRSVARIYWQLTMFIHGSFFNQYSPILEF
jgi:hypothetical protein